MNIPLNKFIDHTLLKAVATEEDIKTLCKEAMDYDFYAVCVNSCYVPLAKECLKDSRVKIASVIGFPLGASSTYSKCQETMDACKNGAEEIDMVINLGLLKSHKYEECQGDIKAVVDTAKEYGGHVKVILETCYLDDQEIVKACELSKAAGAAFVKTSTGFGTDGAKPHHVKLMRDTVGEDMGVKASGGIRDLDSALSMIEAGANRLGVSAGIQIINEYNNKEKDL